MTVELHPELVTESLSIVPIDQRAIATEMLATVEREASAAKTIEIVDDLSFAQGGEALRAIKTAAKNLEAVRTTMKAPVLDAGKRIDSFFRVPAGQLADAEGVLKRRVAAYMAEQERKRREAEELARRERERLERERIERERERERALAEAAKTAEPVFEVPENDPAFEVPELEQPTVIVPEAVKVQGVSTRTVVKARVVDIHAVVTAAAAGNAIALSLLSVDSSVLNTLVRLQGKAIAVPGIETFEETVVSARGL